MNEIGFSTIVIFTAAAAHDDQDRRAPRGRDQTVWSDRLARRVVAVARELVGFVWAIARAA